jgi:hypothetical protein
MDFEPTFYLYDRQIGRVVDYMDGVIPHLLKAQTGVPVFVESMTVIMVARFEHFATSLVASAVRSRESVARDHFRRHGNPDESPVAQSCDLRELIRMARRRVSLKKGGRRFESLFGVLFGFSPWPNDVTLTTIADLVLLRNIFVHEGDTVLDEHARQMHRQAVFARRDRGGTAIYSVDYAAALPFLRDAIVALKAQSDHVKAELQSRA